MPFDSPSLSHDSPVLPPSPAPPVHENRPPAQEDPCPDLHDPERIGDEIARLAAHVHAATCRLLVLLASFHKRQAWGQLGFSSCAHWLS